MVDDYAQGSEADPFDPNLWDWTEREYRIWTPRLEYGFRVDYVDYQWAIEWLWDIKFPRRSNHRKKMAYCYRKCRDYSRGEPALNYSRYLHIEIMKRKNVQPLTELHSLVDHVDGDTFNCTRDNLQWATYQMNRVRGDKTQ